jgi:hypothetical protein
VRWLIVPGFGISLCVRLAYPLLYQFDGLYGQDPYAYYDYSRQIARLFTAGVPLGRFYYPIGFPLLGASGFPLLIVAICGAATCILSGLIAWEAVRRLHYPARAGVIAGVVAWLVMTISPQNVQSGSVIMSDIPALWWALLAVWATLRYERGQRIGWIMLAAAGGAFAAMTRFQYALIVLPIGLYILLIWRGIRIKHALAAVIIGVIAYAPQLVMTLRTPELITDNRILWQPGNITARTFFTSDGTLSNELPNYQYYLLPVRSPYYVSAWLLPLALIGVFAAARNRITVFLLLWFASQYVFLTGIPVQNIRYALIVFPPVAVLIGIGAGWAIQKTNLTPPAPSPQTERGSKSGLSIDRFSINLSEITPLSAGGEGTGVRFVFVLLTLLLLPGLITMVQTTNTLMTNFIGNKNRELAILHWMRANIPEPDATVYRRRSTQSKRAPPMRCST